MPQTYGSPSSPWWGWLRLGPDGQLYPVGRFWTQLTFRSAVLSVSSKSVPPLFSSEYVVGRLQSLRSVWPLDFANLIRVWHRVDESSAANRDWYRLFCIGLHHHVFRDSEQRYPCVIVLFVVIICPSVPVVLKYTEQIWRVRVFWKIATGRG